ncbi:LacI family transcriptional regulator [Streptomyces alfalfae]|uniref:LacI family DNA-binding transcriptional regulator n=1 Tax=Streptomyces alfalfae TaxID=1642299 RepID=A0A1P8TBD2_9ACTN|nr:MULTISPECIES: LacI family DNA-binding transcriptional regulator [Streptomyces]AYA15257.1 LacI family transcriptional regulator [Streptomyces fradiae]APY84924.1 LacI family transcriptional regulator [Streptomyces alfalfae]KUL58543.1 LacI family transcriptional regulator [Streptomyces sp. NRRL S-1521]QQC92955.1 LacI family DNA-binding transcriptional regulator [Streptomyces alfalfae]QUI35258.1 LacI family DNA-binding transcriptional regulator [Streptomyces alfalfae]
MGGVTTSPPRASDWADRGAPRLADIAAQAGVSEATASRVLNGKPGVATGTRQRVLAALDILGYERPLRLKRHSAGLVGLVVPELSNPIFPAFAQVVEQVLAGHGYTPMLCTQMPGGATEDELVEQLEERRVSGIVFLSGLHADTTADPTRYLELAGRGTPFVLINGYNENIPVSFVSPDDRAAARMAVRHLVDLGHERIGLAIGPTRYVPSRRKAEGFTAALHGLLGLAQGEAERLVQRTLFTVEGGHAAASALLDQGCTAMVCGSDMMALGAVRAVRQRGLSVPGDVSVVGFDDSPLIAFTDPPLTTVRQPVQAMATAAVGALLEEIQGNPVQHTEFVFQPELVVRGSTAQAPR